MTLLISTILTLVLFWGMEKNEFLFLHDELLVLGKNDPAGSFFTNNPADFGIANTTILIATLFDKLYYLVTTTLRFELQTSQKLLYFLKVFVSIYLPYLGFKKISKLFLKRAINNLTVFIISLWYAFNTYTIIYWHGNAFSLTLLVCYILAPLAFYYYHQSIFNISVNVHDRLLSIITLFLMSFALYLFPVFLVIIFIHTLFFQLYKKVPFLTFIKNIAILGILYIPFISMHLLIPYDMLTSGATTVNMIGGETYGNLQGGLLYPLLMWFSWGIYTIWEPRNIFTFHEYFKTIPAIIAPLTLYGLVVLDFIKRKSKSEINKIFLLSLLVLLLLVKGTQQPFGEIYLYLIEHVSIFRVFRSPDNKFGFGIVFIVANLLLFASKSYKKWLFISIITIVIFIQGYLFFSAKAIKGENTLTSADRILSIGQEYNEYIDFINKHPAENGYIVTVPPVAFANYNLGQNESHWGQDLLPKFTKFPHVYIDENGSMPTTTYNKIQSAFENGNVDILSGFPIRFFIVRSDIKNYDSYLFGNIDNNIQNRFNLTFKNGLFTVYENKTAPQIIQPQEIKFIAVSPVEYQISIKDLKDSTKIELLQNFNNNWKLYPMSKTNKYFQKILYLFKKTVLDNTHAIENDYANSWNISKDEISKNLSPENFTINQDDSINVDLTLYFKTQSVFYLGVLISSLYLLIIVSTVLVLRLKQKTIYHVKQN